MNAVSDAQQHLSSLSDYDHLECIYIDRMLAKVVDLPTDSKQKNTRRNLQMIRDWMTTDGPGVVLLEALGQLYWRLADLNSKDFEILKQSLGQQQSYLALVRDPKSITLVMQRVKCIQESKFNAFDLFIQELASECNPCKSRALLMCQARLRQAQHRGLLGHRAPNQLHEQVQQSTTLPKFSVRQKRPSQLTRSSKAQSGA